MKKLFKFLNFKGLLRLATVGASFMMTAAVYAQSNNAGLAGAAAKATGAVLSLANLVLAVIMIAGVAFAAAGIVKFKQHKDAPSQVTLSQPITLLVIGIALIWLPQLITGLGQFGSSGNLIHCINGKGGSASIDIQNCMKDSGSGG